MRNSRNESEHARRFAESARQSQRRAPLNAALARIISQRPELHGLLRQAPEAQQLPVLLLASIHFLLLGEPDHPLARWYPNITTNGPDLDAAALRSDLEPFVTERRDELVELVRTRHVQTNEVGRCAALLPAMRLVADDVGTLTHLDVGTSAGLNVMLPRFSYRYDDLTRMGSAHAAVNLDCSTRGNAPIALAGLSVPTIARSCGLDVRPVDITDPDEGRWLEACCWPDQADRFRRLRAAIETARLDPPEILTGDAVETVAGVVERLSGAGHPVITTTWVMNYLPSTRRTAFVDELDGIGADTDISWVWAESPALTPELPHSQALSGEHITELTVMTWRGGERSVRHLAEMHPHGYWIRWL